VNDADKAGAKRALTRPEGDVEEAERCAHLQMRLPSARLAIALKCSTFWFERNELTLVMQTRHKEKMRIAKRIHGGSGKGGGALFSAISRGEEAERDAGEARRNTHQPVKISSSLVKSRALAGNSKFRA
jgi:hypothetical protein